MCTLNIQILTALWKCIHVVHTSGLMSVQLFSIRLSSSVKRHLIDCDFFMLKRVFSFGDLYPTADKILESNERGEFVNL